MDDFAFISAKDIQRITSLALETEETLIMRQIRHKIEKAAFGGKSSVAVRFDLAASKRIRSKLENAGYLVVAGDQISTIVWTKRN